MRAQETNEFKVVSILASRDGAQVRLHDLPAKLGIVHASGSGAAYVPSRFKEWQETKAADTSRAIYSAFCDALLHKTKNPWSEGPPQLVGIYRKWPGRYFATVWKNQCCFGGVPVTGSLGDVQCRNELFERCDPVTLERVENAKKHARE